MGPEIVPPAPTLAKKDRKARVDWPTADRKFGVRLIAAVQEGDAKQVASMITGLKGHDKGGSDGDTPSKSALNFQDDNGYSALHWAAHCDESQMVNTLLGAGADPDAVTARRKGSFLHRAAARDSVRVFQGLQGFSEVKKVDFNAQNVWREAPLHIAASGGHTRAVSLLLSCGANVNARDQWGRTPLTVAVENGEVSTANVLKNAGGTPTRVQITSPPSPPEPCRVVLPVSSVMSEFRSAAAKLAKRRSERRAREAKKKEKKKEKKNSGGEKTMQALKACTSSAYTRPKRKALAQMVEFPGDPHVIGSLIKDRSSVDPCGRDMFGLNALHKFSSWNKVQLIELLLPALTAAEKNQVSRNQSGMTALHFAVDMGAMRAVERLLADPDINPLLPDSNGKSPLDRALHAAEKAKSMGVEPLPDTPAARILAMLRAAVSGAAVSGAAVSGADSEQQE